MQKIFMEHLPCHVTQLDSGNTWRERSQMWSLSCGDVTLALGGGQECPLLHHHAATASPNSDTWETMQRAEEISVSAESLTAFGKRPLKTAVRQPRATLERPPGHFVRRDQVCSRCRDSGRPVRKPVRTAAGFPWFYNSCHTSSRLC